MSSAFKFLCRIALAAVCSALIGCIEIEESHRVSRDGNTDARIVMKVDPRYEPLVFSELEKLMRQDVPQGVRVDTSQRIDGKAAIVIEANGLPANELSTNDRPIGFAVSDGGFLRKRFQYTITVAKKPALPTPHRIKVALPGSIEVTNGKKIADDTVEFDLTHARLGTQFIVTSTAFAFSLSGSGPNRISEGATPVGGPELGWLLPASAVSIALGSAVLGLGLAKRRRGRAAGDLTVPLETISTASGQVDVGSAPSVYCTECGAQNPAVRKFCVQCGHALD